MFFCSESRFCLSYLPRGPSPEAKRQTKPGARNGQNSVKIGSGDVPRTPETLFPSRILCLFHSHPCLPLSYFSLFCLFFFFCIFHSDPCLPLSYFFAMFLLIFLLSFSLGSMFTIVLFCDLVFIDDYREAQWLLNDEEEEEEDEEEEKKKRSTSKTICTNSRSTAPGGI